MKTFPRSFFHGHLPPQEQQRRQVGQGHQAVHGVPQPEHLPQREAAAQSGGGRGSQGVGVFPPAAGEVEQPLPAVAAPGGECGRREQRRAQGNQIGRASCRERV